MNKLTTFTNVNFPFINDIKLSIVLIKKQFLYLFQCFFCIQNDSYFYIFWLAQHNHLKKLHNKNNQTRQTTWSHCNCEILLVVTKACGNFHKFCSDWRVDITCLWCLVKSPSKMAQDKSHRTISHGSKSLQGKISLLTKNLPNIKPTPK